MTEQQYKKREKLVNILSMGMLGVLILYLAFCAWKGLADTLAFPIGIGVLLALHWFFSDILPISYLKMLEGKTDDQKRSYGVYAALELIGFGGLTYFLIDLSGTTGAIIYVVTMFLKKRFLDEFSGIKPEETDEETDGSDETDLEDDEQQQEEAAESAAEEREIELEIPEVRATEEDLIAQTQVQNPES